MKISGLKPSDRVCYAKQGSGLLAVTYSDQEYSNFITSFKSYRLATTASTIR